MLLYVWMYVWMDADLCKDHMDLADPCSPSHEHRGPRLGWQEVSCALVVWAERKPQKGRKETDLTEGLQETGPAGTEG